MHNTAMQITKDLVAASSASLILSLLEDGESYGYAIIQHGGRLMAYMIGPRCLPIPYPGGNRPEG